MAILSRSRLFEILEACRFVRIGVIGDFTLDGYWYADMARSQLSREAPLFPRPVVRETYSPGGAANVAWNLAELGVGEVHALTLMGSDWRGDLLLGLLRRLGVRLDSVLTLPGWTTPFFGKVILTAGAMQQEDARLDFINPDPPQDAIRQEMLRRVAALLPGLDALVVADYSSTGIFNSDFRRSLNRLAEQNPRVKFVADSREHIDCYPSMVIKPNEVEAARFFFPERAAQAVEPGEIEAAALACSSTRERPLVISQGERGCCLFERGKIEHVPAVRVPLPVDPVGAGDTFVAALAASLAAGAEAFEACQVADLAASVTVRCLHITGAAAPAQILDHYDTFFKETL